MALPIPKTPTHLKLLSNNRMFLYTKTLAESGSGFVACDAKGNTAIGHVGDAEIVPGTTRRKTKYLGNHDNGVLYDYTDILAEVPEMESIDSPEQWALMQETGEAPMLAPDTVAPKLKREAAAKEAPKTESPAPPAVNSETPAKPVADKMSIQLPNIDGLGAREAKTLLSQWAEENFKQTVDRRPGLPEVIAQCQALIDVNSQAAAG